MRYIQSEQQGKEEVGFTLIEPVTQCAREFFAVVHETLTELATAVQAVHAVPSPK